MAPVLTVPLVAGYQCIYDIPSPYSNYTEFEAAGGIATDNTIIDYTSLKLLSEDTLVIGEWTVISRIYEIADVCGNTTTEIQDILVRDNILPLLTPPADITVCAENSLGAVAGNINLINYSDNCSEEEDMVLTYTISGATSTSGTGDASGEIFNTGVSTVTYTVTDEAGNASSCSFTVTVNPKPVTSDIIGPDSPLCEAPGEIYTLVSDSTSDYLWTVPSEASIVSDTSGPGVTEIEVNFGSNGGYVTVTEINTYGCFGDTRELEIELSGCQVVADFDMDQTSSLCLYDSVTVWSTSTGISPNTKYNWDFGTDAQPALATGPGPHSVLYGSEGDKSIHLSVEENSTDTASKTIRVTGLASNILGVDQEICEGDSYVFAPDIACREYLWHDGSEREEYVAVNSEIISVSVVDENGCTNTDTVEITVHPKPVIELGADHPVCAAEGEELSVGDFAFYEWSTGDIGNSLTVFSGAGTISLFVTDWNGCSATDEITIFTCDINPVIEIPGIISPNGDGLNDTWIIPNIELYPNAYIQVFDMYGRRIFMADGDYIKTWDGTYNGTQLPVGRYFYIIDFKSQDIQSISGSLTIIR